MPNLSFPSLAFDKKHGSKIIGIDEVGYGPWAGPVVTAAVMILDSRPFENLTINDSKKLTARQREEIFAILCSHPSVVYQVGISQVAEIDTINIREATLLAMSRSLEHPDFAEAEAIIVDGILPLKSKNCEVTTIISGDTKSYHIAAASIIAKVTRDRIMQDLHKQFPAYMWSTNVGYGTRAHAEALGNFGVTIHHRKSYAPIRKLLGK
ncbi:MAG: ribonuclease HII [Alphaproteobacteria bacterium]|nr:ribonuclease HII [Alphaproteobacteria bacterium]OJV46979.1 MAG: ribonuclease HII [Alphaproteobacteria bacterium 43-37]